MDKNKMKNIIMIIMSLVIVALASILILKINTVKYKYYDDNLINIDNKSNIKVKANILNNRSLMVLLTSKDNKIIECNIKLIAYNDQGKQVATKKLKKNILNNGSSLFIFELPYLNYNEYAGNIKLIITKKDTNYINNIDMSKIKYTIKKSIDNNKYTNVTVTLNNGNNQKLLFINGDVIAFKNGRIVGATSFSETNILAGSKVFINTQFAPADRYNKIDYDKISVFINTAIGENN